MHNFVHVFVALALVRICLSKRAKSFTLRSSINPFFSFDRHLGWLVLDFCREGMERLKKGLGFVCAVHCVHTLLPVLISIFIVKSSHFWGGLGVAGLSKEGAGA